MSLKHKIEALLFSSARRMKTEDIARMCKSRIEDVGPLLAQLKQEYEEKNGSIQLLRDADAWKLTVRDEHTDVVAQVVSNTELNKAVMETLAVIAFKYPIRQSEIIKIRNNKAYDHLRELEDLGYITRQRYGRTKLIKLTQKFFDYFDLPQEKLKEEFGTFDGLAKAIEAKEKEIEQMQPVKEKEKPEAGKPEVEHVAPKEAAHEKDEQTPPERPALPQPVQEEGPATVTQIYDNSDSQITEEKEHIGGLDVYDSETAPANEKTEESSDAAESSQESPEPQTHPDTRPAPSGAELDVEQVREEEGLQIKTEEQKAMEKLNKDIDEKADELLHYKEEEKEEKEEKEG